MMSTTPLRGEGGRREGGRQLPHTPIRGGGRRQSGEEGGGGREGGGEGEGDISSQSFHLQPTPLRDEMSYHQHNSLPFVSFSNLDAGFSNFSGLPPPALSDLYGDDDEE